MQRRALQGRLRSLVPDNLPHLYLLSLEKPPCQSCQLGARTLEIKEWQDPPSLQGVGSLEEKTVDEHRQLGKVSRTLFLQKEKFMGTFSYSPLSGLNAHA